MVNNRSIFIRTFISIVKDNFSMVNNRSIFIRTFISLVKDKTKMASVYIFINGIILLLNVCQCVGLLLDDGTIEHIQLQQLRSAVGRSEYNGT
jgi:hypothetical protein